MKALIFGVTGQDGSYLAELLLSKGYEVHGTIRPSARPHLLPSVPTAEIAALHCADITDPESISRVMAAVDPDEIYNLAAQSHVGLSFEMPAHTAQVTGLGTLNALEAMGHFSPRARFYQASSSEMLGNQPGPQSELTPFKPVSPYGWAKVFAHHTAVGYREAYGLHISCGILFNHESPRRGEQFVTRKICKGLARIKAGLQDGLVLGNLSARRDWGYAPEYVEAMWMMLQRDKPGDFVIGTGASYSVHEFLDECLCIAGVSPALVQSTESQGRPSEIHELRANPKKAATHLHWKARTRMPALAKIMMEAELKAVGL